MSVNGLLGQIGAALLGLLTAAFAGFWLRRKGKTLLLEVARSQRWKRATRCLRGAGVVLAAPLFGCVCWVVGCLAAALCEHLMRSPSPVAVSDPGFPDCAFLGWGEVAFYLGTAAFLAGGLSLFFRRKGRAAVILAAVLLAVGTTVWLIQDLRRYEPRSLRFLDRHMGVVIGRPG
jgi:hypothetical protein